VEDNARMQESLRNQHQAAADPLVALSEARAKRTPVEWSTGDISTPAFTGVRVISTSAAKGVQMPALDALGAPVEEVKIEEVAAYIDWGPFFHTWGLRGVYPKIFDNEKYGETARKLFDDAQALLKRILSDKLLSLRAVYGFFPAASLGDDVLVFDDESRRQERTRFFFLRQQRQKEDGKPYRSLSDFVAPKETGLHDFIGCFAVTSGFGLPELLNEYREAQDDYHVIMAEALADRLAEAFAEWLHVKARNDWGYGKSEGLSVEEIIDEKYRGIRPAPGYPACPDHTEKAKIWQLLKVEERTGIRLTESFAMWPGSSVSGLYFGHSASRYFAVGNLAKDQIEDYSARKGVSLREVERWLGPWLGYSVD
jgi:5-methyltetrahydrofolate--homocysteine methyltransferase